jgi:hypothetical protein
METTNLKAKASDIKKTWEKPTLTEIPRSMILGGGNPGNDGNTMATAGPGMQS